MFLYGLFSSLCNTLAVYVQRPETQTETTGLILTGSCGLICKPPDSKAIIC